MGEDNVTKFPELFEGKKILAHLDEADEKQWDRDVARKDACEALFLRLMLEMTDIEEEKVRFWNMLAEKYGLDLHKSMTFVRDQHIIVEGEA